MAKVWLTLCYKVFGKILGKIVTKVGPSFRLTMRKYAFLWFLT